MNVSAVKVAAVRAAKVTVLKGKINLPHILVGVGVVGLVGTAVLAAKATRSVDDILIDALGHKANLDEAHESGELVGRSYAKESLYFYARTTGRILRHYGPTILVGTLSVAAIMGSHGIIMKRNTALVASYNAIDQAFGRYRDEVKTELGEDKEREVFERSSHPLMSDEEGTVGNGVRQRSNLGQGSIYAKWFDETSPYFDRNADVNKMFLLVKQQHFNRKLISDGFVFLNDVYEELGIPRTQAGQLVGWVYDPEDPSRDCAIDFGIFDAADNVRDFVNGFEKAVLLDFNVDGQINDLLQDRF